MSRLLASRFIVASLAAATIVAAGASAAHADVILDTFSDKVAADYPFTVVSDQPFATGNIESGLTGVAGGTRGTLLSSVTGLVPTFDSATLNVFNTSPFSFFDYSSTSGAAAVATLSYGSNAAAGNLGLAIAPASDFIALTFLTYDHANGNDLPVSGSLTSGINTFTLPVETLTTPGKSSKPVTIPLSSLGSVATLDGPLPSTLPAPLGTDFPSGCHHPCAILLRKAPRNPPPSASSPSPPRSSSNAAARNETLGGRPGLKRAPRDRPLILYPSSQSSFPARIILTLFRTR